MHDIKQIRDNKEEFIKNISRKGKDFSTEINEVVANDEKKREYIQKVETLKAKRNETSKLIGQYKREKKDATEIFAQVENIGDEIKELDVKIAELDEKIVRVLEVLPNVPYEQAFDGKSEEDNVEIRKWEE